MSWPTEATLNRALREMLAMCDLEELWGESGPTALGREYQAEGGPLSSGEEVLFQCALSLYNRGNKVDFAYIVDKLDLANLEAVVTLAVACKRGEAAVVRWIAVRALRRLRLAGVHCGSPACNGTRDPDELAVPVLVPQPRDWPFCACTCADGIAARTDAVLPPEGTGV